MQLLRVGVRCTTGRLLPLCPPLFAVTLAVPATRMSVISFGIAVLLGRMLLFLAIAFGVSALFN